ncbi:hypothetical protein QKT49_gp284 [Acanthamoeba castellanii medusavirus]|uniref:C1q domain-containing protein n=1 Tax=Acanthamoeba castellanii medusavirus J1 TaxID=3114988 RepID=A0A3T1CXF9_9VIRU|nr:hypothetical protein QKT49_gp284 [Acanthamoeba castellanii medusavirus]BBI30479.1 hypothetical protein [Acanthamoeba castellanii medusavirus J1]
MTDPYVISDKLSLPGYTPSEAMLLAADDDGTVAVAPITVSSIVKFVRSTNVPLFEVWRVPPQNMVRDGSNGGKYVLGNWLAERPPLEERTSTTPFPAVVLNYFDNSGGALNRSTGIFTVPTSGSYRHSMTLRVVNVSSSRGSFGVFLQVNGVRTLGDYSLNTGDNGFKDYKHFHTEMWHEAGDQIAFQINVNGGDGAHGMFARWAVVRASSIVPVVTPV